MSQIGGGFFVFSARKFVLAQFEIAHRIDVVFYSDRGTICSMNTLTPENARNASSRRSDSCVEEGLR